MQGTIRVLHVIKSLGRGGAEMLLPMGLAVADRSRFEFEYAYFVPWKNAVVPDIEREGGRVTCLGGTGNLAILLASRRLARLIVDRKVDLVHAHLPIAGIAARIAGRITGTPVLYTEHNLHERYNPVTRRLNAATWGWQAGVVAVSADVATSIRRNVGEGVPVHTVLNGVNVRQFAPGVASGDDCRRSLGIPPGAPVVGTVAVFRVQKRLDHWLAIARRLAMDRPDAHFLMVGDGPERARMEQEAAVLGIADRVHWVGLHEDVRPFLAAMDVYLMTSEFEGLPIALLEAMAIGLVPVVTAVGGIGEVVRHMENGYVRPFGALSEIGSDVTALLADAQARNALGMSARATVAARFSMERMQGELERLYCEVLPHKGSHPVFKGGRA